jgi:gamma-glutamyltranspeptidase
MPLRFYRRFNAGPFRVNLSRSGASWSVGRRGAWFTIGTDRARTSVGIPGTGFGWYVQRRIRAFDGLARSPSAYGPQISSANGFRHSGAAVGVPGSLRLMAMLHSRYGKLPWEKLFGPAIDAASNGVRVSSASLEFRHFDRELTNATRPARSAR